MRLIIVKWNNLDIALERDSKITKNIVLNLK